MRRIKDAGRIKTYDKLIEGVKDDPVAFLDDLEFRFAIPKEI